VICGIMSKRCLRLEICLKHSLNGRRGIGYELLLAITSAVSAE